MDGAVQGSFSRRRRTAGFKPRQYLPGDLIGFSGADVLSDAINLATWGIPRYSLSHVAIVTDPVDRLGLNEPVLWESTLLCDLPCLYAGGRVEGVQCHRILDRVSAYRGKVWHYPLILPLQPWQRVHLSCWCAAHAGSDYDALGAFRSREWGFGWLEQRLGRENLHRLFCSEFVAAAYRTAGVWPCKNVSKWNPNRLARKLRADGKLLKPLRRK